MQVNPEQKKNDAGRFYILDASRFLAAVAVVLFHYLFLGWSGGHVDSVKFESAGEVFKYGYLGVQFFFLISGFVIFMSIQRGGVVDFIASRVSRLYPAYWFGVLLTSAFVTLLGSNSHEIKLTTLLANLTMLQKFLGHADVDGSYWTLALELIFYAWMAFLLMLRSVHNFEKASFVFLLISLYAKVFYIPKAIGLLLLVDYSPLFVSGATFYLISREGINLFRVSTIVLSFFLTQYHSIFIQLPKIQAVHSSKFSPEVVLLLISIFYMFFVGMSLGLLGGFKSRLFAFLGSLTYPLYLIHQEAGYVLIDLIGRRADKYTAVVTVLLACLVASYLIHVLIEKKLTAPMRGIIKKYLIRWFMQKT